MPWPAVINTFSIGLDLGLAFGAAIITGEQEVSLKGSLSTLSVVNTATNTAVIKVGLPAELKVTLSYPLEGKAPVVTLYNTPTTSTTLIIGMPGFLSDSFETAAVTPPSGWAKTGVSQEGFTFTYKGPDKQAWNQTLEIIIANVVSNPGLTGDAKGLVTAKMDGVTSTRTSNTSLNASPAKLQLTPLQFAAAIGWKVVLGTNVNFKIKQGPQNGSANVTTPPSGFEALPPGSETSTVVTDPQGIDWLVGFKFQIQDNQPVMLAAWQQYDSPTVPNKTYFPSGVYPLSDSPQQISISYRNVSSAANPVLTITATLQSD